MLSGSGNFHSGHADGNATFEIGFKMASLTDPDSQTLFEVGNANKGLSFTIGDGGLAGDDATGGQHDDLRFAIGGGSSPATESLTVDLPDWADDDFVQVVGVVDNTEDAMRLYRHGKSAAQAALPGLADWMGSDLAGLGYQEAGLGANPHGAYPDGEHPFDTGDRGFLGQIGIFRIYEYAMSGHQVARNYLSVDLSPEPGTAALLGPGAVPSCAAAGAREGRGGHTSDGERTRFLPRGRADAMDCRAEAGLL